MTLVFLRVWAVDEVKAQTCPWIEALECVQFSWETSIELAII